MSTTKPNSIFDLNWLVGAILLFAVVLYARQNLMPGKSDKLNIEPPADTFFESKIASESGTVLVKFGADWCGPCKALDATLAEYSKSKDAIKVVFVDVDKQPELASHYGVRGIPHSFLFKEGKVLDDRVGSMPISEVRNWVAGHNQPSE